MVDAAVDPAVDSKVDAGVDVFVGTVMFADPPVDLSDEPSVEPSVDSPVDALVDEPAPDTGGAASGFGLPLSVLGSVGEASENKPLGSSTGRHVHADHDKPQMEQIPFPQAHITSL